MANDLLPSFGSGATEKPFDATKTGIAVNTAKAFLPELGNTLKGIGQGIARGVGSIGLSVGKVLGGEDTLTPEDIKNEKIRHLYKGVFGEEPMTDMATDIARREQSIANSPFAQKIGVNKIALPLAFGSIIGERTIDMSPFGGEAKVIKQLAAERDAAKVFDTLIGAKFTQESATRLSPLLAKADTEEEVADILRMTIAKEGGDIIKNTPKDVLMNAIKEAGPARQELEQMYTAERAARAETVGEIQAKASGQAGYHESLAALKGKLVDKTPDFDPPKLAQNEVDDVFNQIAQHSELDVYEKVSASNGLQKLLQGEIPQKSQLSLLEDVFGKEMVETVLAKRSTLSKMGDKIVSLINTPRVLITSLDMSAPLRQGIMLTITRPSAAKGAFKEMFSQVFSQKNFENWFKDLEKHPMRDLMKKSDLYIANPTKVSGGLADREEAFMTNIAEKLPWVEASQRAYVGYLNKLRVDTFSSLAKQFIDEGMSPTKNPEIFKALANFVNNASGRGSLGKLGRSASILNGVFFSPRLIASRFNMLNPAWYFKQPKPVRMEAIKTMGKFVGFGLTVLALAKAGGAEVEEDPRSSDFGKIKIGNTRWDIWGGFQQWVRTFAQIASGERKTSKGDIVELSKKKYPFESRKDVAEKFGVSKLAPVPGLLYELMNGQKMFGGDMTLKSEVLENTIPLYLQDMKDAIQEMGPGAIFGVGIPGFFGVGTQTYVDKTKGKDLLESF